MPVDIAHRGYLIEKSKQYNLPGVRYHAEVIVTNVMADVVSGRALVSNVNFLN